jgi:DNA-directed RNA polymerase specialized sigma24 family protein
MTMKTDDYTRIGNSGGRFPTTDWTVIGEVRPEDDPRSRPLIAGLVRDYWKPVYCYLRRKGYRNEDAKDLTQGFFEEVVLGRELIQRADPAKGRFRTLMLTALARYLANVHRGQTARKRIPPDKLIALEQVNGGDLPQSAPDLPQEESFHYAWVAGLLDRVLVEVEAECGSRGMGVHWSLFRDRVLEPIMEDEDPPPLAELCARYDLREAGRASNMIFAVKRRLQAALKRHVRQSVACEEEISEEMAALRQFLAGK